MSGISTVEIWRGPSPVDGSPIVAIVTNLDLPSENRKTGDMAQLYILRADMSPVRSATDGYDAATCGNCPLRPSVSDGVRCYVNTGWIGAWRSWQSGKVPIRAPREVGEYLRSVGLELREGAYGDPAMLPQSVRDDLHLNGKVNGTSYTHQWSEAWADQRGKAYSMASVQSLDEKRAANALGWRTYRVTDGDLEPDEILCPELTRNASCKNCKLCSGARRNAKNIVIRPLR